MSKKQFMRFALLLFRYGALMACMLLLFFARIGSDISPFAMAFVFASYALPFHKAIIVVGAFSCSLFVSASHVDVISVLFGLGVFVIGARTATSIVQKYKRVRALPVLAIFYVLSNSYSIANASMANIDIFYLAIVSVVLGVVFFLCSWQVIRAYVVKRMRVPFTIDQKICACVCIVVLSLGLSRMDGGAFSIHKFITVLAILISVSSFSTQKALVIAICLGLGQTLDTGNLNYIAINASLSVIAVAFSSRDRLYNVIAVVVADIVLGTYFDAYLYYNIYALLPVFVAAVIYVLMPRAFSKYFDGGRFVLSDNLISKNTINRNRAGVYSRLTELASVFGEMQHVYRGLVSRSAPPEKYKTTIAAHILESVCGRCASRLECNKTAVGAEDLRLGLESLCYSGLLRGSVNFMDLPQSFALNCSKVNSIIGVTNSILRENAKNMEESIALDAGKMLVSSLFGNISELITRFAKDACASVVFDSARSDAIKEELLYKNIVVSDCLITKIGICDYCVSVLVPRVVKDSPDIARVVSRVLKHKMQVDSIDDGETAGFSIVTLRSAPKFEAIFGVAQVNKNFQITCGDVFSFLRINAERTMMAICDGMGTGESASMASTIALTLIENFYKVGFPSDMIVTSVNQLLSTTNRDVFSALDVAVFNLNSGEVDFVKVGASEGYIKREREVEMVEAGSLPLGVLEEMQPKLTRAVVSEKDYVVLVSDGVMDAFCERVALGNFINNVTAKTPQDLADQIMAECLNRSGKVAADDCTVIVARLKIQK